MRRCGITVTLGAMAVTLAAAGSWAASVPVLITPGSTGGEPVIGEKCPTFLWGADQSFRSFELMVYQLTATGDDSASLPAGPIISEPIPGSARGWTPALDRCLDPGNRYAWVLRAVGYDGKAQWSEPRIFRVRHVPSRLEVQQALEVLQEFLQKPPQAMKARSDATAPEATFEPKTTGNVATEVLDNPLVDVAAAIHGESTSGEEPTVGVRGVIHGAGAAGLFLNTAEGTILSLHDPRGEVFAVSTGGTVETRGQVAASSFVGDGAGITNIVAEDLDCASCVGGAEILNSSLTGDDIANGSIPGTDIADRTIDNNKIGFNEITSAEIADGLVYGIDIADGSLTGVDVASDSIYGSDVADESLTGADIADGSILGQDIGDLADGSIEGDDLETIWAVAVECGGGCGDSTLAEICSTAGAGLRPVFVDCDEVTFFQASVGCPGENDNSCAARQLVASDPLSFYCGDQIGWDANVYCMEN